MESGVEDLKQLIKVFQQQILEQSGQLLSETLIEHWVCPRNPGPMKHPDGHARITGPCGDTMEIYLRVDGERITKASFETDGCVTTIVSASMAVELATGKTIAQALTISQQLILDELGGLPADSQHCALLAANTLRAAIEDVVRNRDQPWKRLYR